MCSCTPAQLFLQTTRTINMTVYNEQELRENCSFNEKSKDFNLPVRTDIVPKKNPTQTKPPRSSNFLHFFLEKSGDIWKKIIQLIKIKNRVWLKPKVCNRMVLISLLSLKASLKAGD